MRRVGDLFDRITDPDNLSLAFDKAARGKRDRRSVRWAMRRREELLVNLRWYLVTGSYRVSPYAVRTIHEPKTREIHILPFYPDRIVQHAIMNVLEPVWDSMMVPQSYSCRLGKGQHRACRRVFRFVRQYKYALQCDISKFYPSLDHSLLKQAVRRTLKDIRLIHLLDRVIDSDYDGRGVPIGSLLSQWFGNIYLTGLDRCILRGKLAAGYTRYCDDFILFADDKATLYKALDAVRTWLAAMHMTLSRYRVYPTAQGVDFLGYRCFPEGYVLLRRRTARRIAKRVRGIWRHVHGGKALSLMVGRLASAYGWLKFASCQHFRERLHFDELFGIFRTRQREETNHARLSRLS